MAKVTLVYRGGRMAATEEEQQAGMAEWGAWFGALGEAVVDGGAPFAGTATLPAGASPLPLTGYIIEADDLASATTLAAGCPVLAHGGSVDVCECIDLSA